MRSSRTSAILGAALSALACQSPRPAVERMAAEKTSDPAASAPIDSTALAAFTYAAGNWDWYNGDSTCLGNTHTVGFSPDRRTMTITFKQPLDTATGRRVASYRVLAAGSGIVPEVPFAIRAAMDAETRRTAKGELVVWDLLLASPNRYHWHRTDWAGRAVTRAIIRCDGSRPLEQWHPPSDGASRS
jgi:hypothetical protein